MVSNYVDYNIGILYYFHLGSNCDLFVTLSHAICTMRIKKKKKKYPDIIVQIVLPYMYVLLIQVMRSR